MNPSPENNVSLTDGPMIQTSLGSKCSKVSFVGDLTVH